MPETVGHASFSSCLNHILFSRRLSKANAEGSLFAAMSKKRVRVDEFLLSPLFACHTNAAEIARKRQVILLSV